MEAGRQLRALPLPHSNLLVSPIKELLHWSGVPVLAANAQGTYLDLLALMTNGAYVHGSHRTVTNTERVLSQLPPPAQDKR